MSNRLTAKRPPNAAVHLVDTVVELSARDSKDRYAAYLHDESKMTASSAVSISFPKDVAELSAIVSQLHEDSAVINVSGARTGLVGGAVPGADGHIVSLEKLCGINFGGANAEPSVCVSAGTTLADLSQAIAQTLPDWYFPVDPTETAASIGGAVATNAGGARSFRYGSVRPWVRALTMVLASGSVLKLRRGEVIADDGALELVDDGDARRLKGTSLPKPRTKNAIGYTYGPTVDPIDIVIGAEGTLGIIAEVELALARRPAHQLYCMQFLDDEETALRVVNAIRSCNELDTLAIEFMDRRSVAFAAQSPVVAKTGLLELAAKPGAEREGTDAQRAAIYCEFVLGAEEDLENVLGTVAEVVSAAGGDPECVAGGVEERDIRRIKAFRHAVPERINSIIQSRKQMFPQLHKVATDMAVPNESLEWLYHLYRTTLDERGFEYAVFGHAGDNHFHVNLLPRDDRELDAAKATYLELAKQVVARGGAVAVEHGIGRLKKSFLRVQYNDAQIETMRAIKRFFDPNWRLNPGVLLDCDESDLRPS